MAPGPPPPGGPRGGSGAVGAPGGGGGAFPNPPHGVRGGPIRFGLDKFFNVLTDWPRYLAGWVDDLMPGSAQSFMYAVGGIEILAGVLVALRPRYGAPIVALWLAGIIFNLLTGPGYYDVALRDFGLLLGALTLTRLALAYDRPR